MELGIKELIQKLDIEEKKWRRSNYQEKEKLIAEAGYKLLGSFRVGREQVYQIEPKGSELIQVIAFLRDYGIKPKQLKTFLNFLLVLKSNGQLPLSQVAKMAGIAPSTAYNWINKIELLEKRNGEGFLKRHKKALKVKYDALSNREICTEEEWKQFTDFYSECIAKKKKPKQIYNTWREKTGYVYKQVSIINSNGFYNEEFFDLLSIAIEQIG